MNCISINYKNSDVNFRKKFAFSKQTQSEFMKELLSSGTVDQCVFLCTCNRTELYFCGDKASKEHATSLLADFGKVSVTRLDRHIMYFCGESACTHLFKVVCGIDSMVIGEDEILGQSKDAYEFSKSLGYTGYELNMTFQSAFACAKKIKTETVISKTSVSTATLASNEASRFSDYVNVLIIGSTGRIGSIVLKNLSSHKNVSVTATIRKRCTDVLLGEKANVKYVDYDERYKYIENADCIISATSSPHYTVTLFDLQKEKISEKNRLFIDLAVPPDIDPSIGSINGATLCNIDYFEKLAKENNDLKLDSVESAKLIIANCIDELKKDMEFHSFMPSMENVKRAASNKTLEYIIYKMKSELNSHEFSHFLGVLKKIDD